MHYDLINSKIQILRSDFPKLSNENYYWSDLVGLSVLNSEETVFTKKELSDIEKKKIRLEYKNLLPMKK